MGIGVAAMELKANPLRIPIGCQAYPVERQQVRC